ncbi:enoyl-[acyl-carrier protein] reductase I [Chitinophaga eiseniae]|uniref:Enoyl-[acyl-carrier protein] reductase I n=1 Tax=Chitinophaga eiseniae TaxID=634771 RepID=A0A1T4LZ23_9BACT|nr:SDR family oxidoreductase [Chitinophaga eiseniae]SJZ59907.1 enoyl-[acyl-carrier protein] reductase I [Chitinophaga eiseniae]
MVKEFASKEYWALVLGGSSGLGLASAYKLAAHGMHVCIVHRNAGIEMEAVNAAFEALRATGVQVMTFNINAAQAERRTLVLKELQRRMGPQGRVRCLLHSVAKGTLKAMTGTPALETDDLMITLEHMAVSLYDWTREIFEQGLFAADARVLSFTSEGSHRAWKHYAAVSAAKAALEAISRSIALEFAPYGIRSNCIQAGATDTRSLRMIPGHEQLLEHSLARSPFGRLTTAEDVANMVYLLCKDEAAWVNGAVIPVDGGAHIQ